MSSEKNYHNRDYNINPRIRELLEKKSGKKFDLSYVQLEKIISDLRGEYNKPSSQFTQNDKNRLVNHLLYASPVKRGVDVEIVEDILPVYNTEVSIKTDKVIKNVLLMPQNEKIKFEVKEDRITYSVDKFECHQMVVLEY